MADLVERLREFASHVRRGSELWVLFDEAATRIQELEAGLREAREIIEDMPMTLISPHLKSLDRIDSLLTTSGAGEATLTEKVKS